MWFIILQLLPVLSYCVCRTKVYRLIHKCTAVIHRFMSMLAVTFVDRCLICYTDLHALGCLLLIGVS